MTDQAATFPVQTSLDPWFWRGALFIAVLLLIYITLEPFADLSGVVANSNEGGNLVTLYLLLAGLAAAVFFKLEPRERQVLRRAFTPGLIAFYLWVLVSVFTSTDVALSARRLFPLLAVTIFGAGLFLLPRSPQHLAGLLAFICGSLLFLSYFGVIFLPNLSIHLASDPGEPQLAGDWRGVFGHKNTAAGMFAIVGFMGIYVARIKNRAAGTVIFLLATVFLYNSGGKTSFGMYFTTILVSALAINVRAQWLRSALILFPFAVLALLGVGSVMFPALGSFTASLPIDATFTGRTEIWRFALDNAATRPWLGFGYEAFWATDFAKYGSDNPEVWSGAASHAHNAFLNVALTMGLPGVILTVAVFVFGGLKRFNRAWAATEDRTLLLLFLQIWSFGLYLANLESVLVFKYDPVWTTFLFAFFGLHYLGNFPLSSETDAKVNFDAYQENPA